MAGIDHLGIAVGDAARADEAFVKLGFTVSGGRVAFGVGGHLDLRAPRPATWPQAREGLAVVGLGAVGGLDGDPETLGGTLEPASPAEAGQEHANGALGLLALLVASDDVEATAVAWGRLFAVSPEPHGAARVARGAEQVVVALPTASLRYLWGEDAILETPRPFLAGAVLRVATIDTPQVHLQKAKVPTIASNGVVRLNARHAMGVLLAFAESFDITRLLPE